MSVPAEAIPTTPTDWQYGDDGAPTESNVPFNWTGIPTEAIDVGFRFRELAALWKQETGHLSLLSQRVTHPAYLRIIAMGRSAVPHILADLQHTPEHWFHALFTLTGANPVPANFAGTISDAADLWISWGRQRGYIDNAITRPDWHLP